MMSQVVKKEEFEDYRHCKLTTELLKRRNEYSPDFLELKMKEKIPVFVYGTLKIGQRNHGVLKDSIYLGEGYTATRNYVMENSEMDFPIVFQIPSTAVAGHSVLGEVFMVDPMTLLELDRIESNGEMYKREERWVFLPDQKAYGNLRPSMKCWIYLADMDFWQQYNTSVIHPKVVGEDKSKKIYEWMPSFSHQLFRYEEYMNDRIPF